MIKHGHAFAGRRSSEYRTWYAMKQRCTNPNVEHYDRYGGRGITVCERWANSFCNFLADMGLKPSRRHSIDRVNNDGNYEPGNCRWATQKEQANNCSRVVLNTCSHGHLYDEKNTYWWKKRRKCRICHAKVTLRRYHEKKIVDLADSQRGDR